MTRWFKRWIDFWENRSIQIRRYHGVLVLVVEVEETNRLACSEGRDIQRMQDEIGLLVRANDSLQ